MPRLININPRTRNGRQTSLFLVSIVLVMLMPSHAAARSFYAEGSELLIGTDPKAMAMSGAFVAAADDIYAIYWNPAGLTGKPNAEITLSYQFKSQFGQPDFLGVKTPSYRLPGTSLQFNFAAARVTRLYIEAKGQFSPDDFESVFIEYALPEIPPDFDGEITSKTLDYRFAVSVGPADNKRWRAGITIGRINCGTRSCGVSASDPNNWTVASTDAEAWFMNGGLQLNITDKLGIGLTVNDIYTTLEVKTVVEDNNGSREENFRTSFPRQFSTGVIWRQDTHISATLDYQYLKGEYGSAAIDFRLLRSGLEYRLPEFALRVGGLLPVKLETASSGDIADNLPFPVALSVGAGYITKLFSADVVIYPHPIMSYQQREPVPTLHASFTMNF